MAAKTIGRLGVVLLVGFALSLTVPSWAGAATFADPGIATRDAQCPSRADSSSTTAVLKTIPVGGGPQGLAVDSNDDVVYVTNADSDSLSVIDGATGAVARTVAGFSEPIGVAVNELDDTVYVVNTDDSSVAVLSGSSLSRVGVIASIPAPWAVAVDQSDDTVYVTAWQGVASQGSVAVVSGHAFTVADTIVIEGNAPIALAVNDRDDSVYVSGSQGESVAVINGRTRIIDDTIGLLGNAWGAAVDQVDDTVYIANTTTSTLTAIAGRTASIATTVTLPPTPWNVAVDDASSTVYVTEGPANTVAMIDGRSASVERYISVGSFPIAIAVDQSGPNAGVVYVANSDDSSVSVLGRVTPSLASTWGAASSSLTVSVDAPQVAFAMEGSTVATVCFFPEAGGAGVPGTGLRSRGGDEWSVTIPRGLAPGDYAVSVGFEGGTTAGAGTFTIPSLQIVGSRDTTKPAYAVVTGSSVGLAGQRVTPMVRLSGQARYSAGRGVRTVSSDGTFTWQRKSRGTVRVYFVADHGVRSNAVVISPS